ncbi:MAG: DNA gyrase subunit A [Coriobacteriia bacterium]|nr:DNA gyrase subunit A [Coriobacteriia bacterium]
MARKKKPETKHYDNPNVVGLHSAVLDQPITETLETNYMPYAMSVIVSRAIPEIDGFKPSHRKLLYTMYKMGLLKGARQKSANIVGQTMKLNPHGDAAIYETMVRLTTGNEALVAPFVESKGNFGKCYSNDMSYAASRYTEAKLAPICAEIFRDIDKDPVDFVDSYDGTTTEPRLLPTTFPNVLVSQNSGIAVGMASEICGFNLNEVCEAAIGYIKDPAFDLFSAMPAPDFSTGGEIIYDRAQMEQIYATGRGGFSVRSRWRWQPKERIIEVYEIPHTTSTDKIIERVVALSKAGKLKEVSDIRDETDLGGLRIAIDLKRGVDPEALMGKLFKSTPLQDTYNCNFNILVDGYPKVMGVREILDKWIAWRLDSVRRTTAYERDKKAEKLHLLQGLEAILLDIDEAIRIIRHTKLEADVVPNLMAGFGIDQVQAEFVADIRLRNINEEYILNRTKEIAELSEAIAKLEKILGSERLQRKVVCDALATVNKNHVVPRRTGLVAAEDVPEVDDTPQVEDYPVTVVVSEDGYLKKIPEKSMRNAGEQKFKEGDALLTQFESSNARELLVFASQKQVYKCRLADFADSKASAMGDFLPSKLEMDAGEQMAFVVDPGDFTGCVLLFFEDGRVCRIATSAYQTKQNRKKLKNAVYDGARLVFAMPFKEDLDVAFSTSDGNLVVFNTSILLTKTTNSTQGVRGMTPKKGRTLTGAGPAATFLEQGTNPEKFRTHTLPSAGTALSLWD